MTNPTTSSEAVDRFGDRRRRMPVVGFGFLGALLSLLIFGVCARWSFAWVETRGLQQAWLRVCDLVEQEMLPPADRHEQQRQVSFIEHCRRDAAGETQLILKSSQPKREFARRMTDRLSIFRISHLYISAPQETWSIWQGESVDTCARAKLIDGEVVLVEVLDDSPAQEAGLRAGDVILSVDARPLSEAQEVQSVSGVWEVLRTHRRERRRGQGLDLQRAPEVSQASNAEANSAIESRLSVPIQARPLQVPLSPSLWRLRSGTAYMRIPSFLPQVFEGEAWQEMRVALGELSRSRTQLIVDVRRNAGGSFPAALRAISALSCKPGLVGWVHRGFVPSQDEALQYALPDDLSAHLQLERLSRDGALSLMSHSQSLCFSGSVLVLMDEETASVAEIFAQAMKERPQTRVLGWPSAGQVVMARWFDLDSIGPGYNLVLPVARYESAQGQSLERRGVRPDVELVRDLESARHLGDPWLEWADEFARTGRFPSGGSVSF